jgi:basic amino acid/polyamine antiporter, APA family
MAVRGTRRRGGCGRGPDGGELRGAAEGRLAEQAAGLLFFAFAGYARITTLGEEVRDPRRVIPRAIPLALVIVLVVYAAVAVAVLSVLGGAGLAAVAAGPAEAVRAVGCRVWFPWYAPEQRWRLWDHS